MPQLGRDRHRGDDHPVDEGGRGPGGPGRAALRGLHGQGRLRGARSPASGVLTEILVPEGETVEVGARLAVIGDAAARRPAPAAAPPAAPHPQPAAPPPPRHPRRHRRRPAPPPATTAQAAAAPRRPCPQRRSGTPRPLLPPPPAPEPAPAAASPDGGRTTAPAALAGRAPPAGRATGIDPAEVAGTGVGGRITREDVLGHRRPPATPSGAAVRRRRHRRPAPRPPPPAAAPAAGRRPVVTAPVAPGRRAPAPPQPRRAAGHGPAAPAATAVDGHAAPTPGTGWCPSPTCGGGRPSTWSAPRPPRPTPSSPTRPTSRTSSGSAGPGATASGPRRASRSPTFRSSPGPRSRRCGTSPTSTPRWPRTRSSSTSRSTWASPSTSTTRGSSSRSSTGPRRSPSAGVARRIRDLADRARTRQLTADDIAGGTFSITNDGPFGTYFTVPIINQPQVAILATDGIKRRPVVVELPDGSESIAIHSTGRPRDELGPPGRGRRLRLVVPRRMCRAARHPRLGRRAVGGRRCCGSASSAGSPTRRPGPPARPGRARPTDDYLLLLEHPHVYTLGVRADPAHVLVDPASVGRRLVRDRPGRRRHLPRARPARRSTRSHRRRRSRVPGRHHVRPARAGGDRRAGRPRGGGRVGRGGSPPGVPRDLAGDRHGPRRARWAPSECARCGVPAAGAARCTGWRSTSTATSSMFDHIVPCGIADLPGHLAGGRGARPRDGRGGRRPVVARAAAAWGRRAVDEQAVTVPSAAAAATAVRAGRRPAPRCAGSARPASTRRRAWPAATRKPEWLRVPARMGEDYLRPGPDGPRPRPGHGVRGGRLPQHLRVLGRRDGHLHGERRPLHPGLRLLPGRHPPPPAAGPDGARPGGRGGGPHAAWPTPW